MEHPFTWLVDGDGERVKLDCEIVPWIQRLWDMELETCNSCQGNFGYVWVEFLSADDALDFLNIIVAHGDDDLAHRAANPCDISPSDAADYLANRYHAWPDLWLVHANVAKYDDSEEGVAEHWDSLSARSSCEGDRRIKRARH